MSVILRDMQSVGSNLYMFFFWVFLFWQEWLELRILLPPIEVYIRTWNSRKAPIRHYMLLVYKVALIKCYKLLLCWLIQYKGIHMLWYLSTMRTFTRISNKILWGVIIHYTFFNHVELFDGELIVFWSKSLKWFFLE